MIEIYNNLFIGSQDDYENNIKHKTDWSVIHACKDPNHRELLGYQGRSAPKDHQEYFFAYRGDRLFLNLIDPPNPDFIPKLIIDEALKFINLTLKIGKKILVHCNQGESRAPGIGFLYLVAYSDRLDSSSLSNALNDFKILYSLFKPGAGIHGFIQKNYQYYLKFNNQG